ncbi:single-stranded-DNA-specific exonuclease RecJ [Candidatus Roizmanbacteria bacterium]|nr:single-stranded-DNA-specific exonuclease RecJ [Candidatus Roizmanbacteria bacterium]
MKISYKYELLSTDTLSEKEVVNKLLESRNITDITTFLNPINPAAIQIADFGYEKEIKTTLTLLEEIKQKDQTVVVYTDYDADGITGGTILWETLHLLGFKVMPYVPHRKMEGYGFSIRGIDTVKKEFDPTLIISVDHGISGREKIQYARNLGLHVIVTDHHLKPKHIPEDADAIFHIPVLSGSGVAYFFAKLIFEHFQKTTSKDINEKLTHNFQHDYLALAAIGTVADLVPLQGPSRSVVKYGLAAFASVNKIGLKQIMKDAGIDGKPITPYEIGFVIAPRINAIGRLEHAIDALRLLCTTSTTKAEELSFKIDDLNKTRQDLVKVAVQEAKEMVELITTEQGVLPNIIVLTSQSWHEGIIGLIAAKMVEEYHRPAIIMTSGDGIYKGSARSIPSFHITEFLQSMQELLLGAGGHKQAAGFSLEVGKLGLFLERVQKGAMELASSIDLEKVIEADIKMPIQRATMKLVEELEKLSPFGIGNPKPLFYTEGVLLDARLFGKGNEHIRLYVRDPEVKMNPIEILAFSHADIFPTLKPHMKLGVVYTLDKNIWMGKERLQAICNHIVVNA